MDKNAIYGTGLETKAFRISMASIDQYKHRLLGFANCPSDFDFVYRNSTRQIAIYELEQSIPSDEKDFDGKAGDILIGGGSGEAQALRISMPGCVKFFFTDWEEIEEYDEIFKSFWSPTTSFKFCNGYMKLGWNPEVEVEFWLAENVCGYLIKELEMYPNFNVGSVIVEKALFTKL